MLDPDRTLEVRYGNCRAKFRPWYGANDSGLQTIQVKRCGLCEGDPLMKLMSVSRVSAEVGGRLLQNRGGKQCMLPVAGFFDRAVSGGLTC